MPTLLDTQRQFAEALFECSPVLIQDQIQTGTISAKTGLDVYRNNVFTNLREALRTLFPVINQLVGEAFFNYATECFIHDYPSPAGDLNQYGEAFAEFLASFEPAAELVYLPDIARLEWAVHIVYHAQNAVGLDMQRLALISPNAYGNLRFTLNPACKLVQSVYPVHDIWQVNQPDHTGNDRVDLDAGDVSLLVARRKNRIVLDTLTAGESVFLSATANQESFSSACSQAMRTDPNFNLSEAMSGFVQNAILIDFDHANT